MEASIIEIMVAEGVRQYEASPKYFKYQKSGMFVLFTLRLFENAQRVKTILHPPKLSLLFMKK